MKFVIEVFPYGKIMFSISHSALEIVQKESPEGGHLCPPF
jgi:hypothetical protein